MHIGFLSFPGHGHVNPTLPIVEELVRRGHRVSYAITEEFVAAVEGAGATALTIPGSPIPAMRGTDPARMAGRMQTMIDDALAAFEPVAAAWSADPVDAICYDNMFSTAPMLIEKLDVPGIAYNPSYASNERYSPRQAMMSGFAGQDGGPERFARMRELIGAASGRVAAFAEQQGVTPPAFFDATPEALNLVFIPKAFQPQADTFDDRFVFVGPDLGSRADDDWRPAESDRPLLFISLGTAFNDRPEFFRSCIEAFGGGRWQVAMAIGRATEVDDLGEIPDNFEIRPYFPQPAVLRHADVFVSHTGMNSTMEALASGVPLVAVPQMPEQQMNAQQVDDLGLGRRLDTETVTAEQLRDAVTAVADDPQLRARVADFATDLARAGGATAAVDAIETHLSVPAPV
ncbi:macrolide family glycosyltransferase [Microlunatus soli]|uniref:Glycosyltransferase, MGT family n=1 Tax=Microlunatus soli TaxID=630515 RepID=A0A1H1WUL4_9ACTN|nr:macrolide family glycosyltransferase [Microlunatus soli]SDS99849.1 glycosyltransferase, MGT family [Microlunatus soli]